MTPSEIRNAALEVDRDALDQIMKYAEKHFIGPVNGRWSAQESQHRIKTVIESLARCALKRSPPAQDEKAEGVDLAKGDYVLATKYGDGDSKDHWFVGFYSHHSGDRIHVIDNQGQDPRPNGFRRAEKISQELGKYLCDHAKEIEEGNKSLWHFVAEDRVRQLQSSNARMRKAIQTMLSLFDDEEDIRIQTKDNDQDMLAANALGGLREALKES